MGERAATWPPAVAPMLATAGSVPSGPGWVYEFKWDGIRGIVTTSDRGGLRITSRNDLDITSSFPDLGPLSGYRSLTLDGEIVALDPRTGAPSFALLQRRMHIRNPPAALVAAVPVRFFAFDLLHRKSTSLLDRPWSVRRKLLDDSGVDDLSPAFDGDGQDVLEAARTQGLEGVVAKRVDGLYEPGRRSRTWIKTPLFTTTEAIVCGYTLGEGRRAGTIGALLLGAYDEDDQLIFLGHVGTGFTDKVLDDLYARLTTLETSASPYAGPVPREYARKAHWTRPELVGEVVYRNVTPDNRLRHPSWRGLRPERGPAEVRWDQRG
ncbi:non-homologous end-joining DNA ligase [Hamadaea tsunoensis]|uniref:non-homologous end-joining DNA ligase n=1 Tax=Hamadaea tsunoensis TaxID=53368 RepID=UPI001FE14B0D|nr:non-homologous end-joining DNA ligase [Hamadaea tsunoensis]